MLQTLMFLFLKIYYSKPLFISDSHSKLANGLFTFAGFPSSISEIQLALELGLKGFVVAEDRLMHAYVCDQHAKVLCVLYV